MSDQVIDKIQAILRKASEENNSSEAEREVAMRAANKLLLKHGLTMQDVEVGDEQSGDAFEHEGYITTEGDADSWRGLLLHRIARVYFCKVYYIPIGNNAKRYILIGRENNAATCRAMFELVAPQIEVEFNIAVSKMSQQARFARRYALSVTTLGEDLSDEELAAAGRDHFEQILLAEDRDAAIDDIRDRCEIDSVHYARKVRTYIMRLEIAPHDTENLGVWRRSFFEAASTRVGNRLHDLMREEVEDLGEPGTALVKNEKIDLDAFLESLDLGLRSKQSNRQYDRHGGDAGVKAGDRADLSGHRKMSGGGTRELEA